MENMKTFKMKFQSANLLEAEVGTNTPQGGDAGHGGKTIFTIRNPHLNTSMEVEVQDDKNKKTLIETPKEVTIRLFGDTEANTFIEALKFALYILKTQNSGRAAIE